MNSKRLLPLTNTILLTIACMLLTATALFTATTRTVEALDGNQIRTTLTVTDTFAGEPTPLLMLTIFDPWNSVLGADSPRFVLYDNGQVIYMRENDGWEYATVQLTRTQADMLFEQLVGDWQAQREFFMLDDYYDHLLMTDQPSTTIYLFDPHTGGKSVGVYGNLETDEARDLTPDTFLDIYDQVLAYQSAEAETWLPDYFEVVVWEYEYSDPTRWPADFPDLNSPSTVKRDSVYSLYVPIEEYETFIELAEDASAFLINGETWAFSVRYPFPHEHPASET